MNTSLDGNPLVRPGGLKNALSGPGVKSPYGGYPETSQEGNLRLDSQRIGWDFPRFSWAEAVPHYRGASHARSCAYVHHDTAQVRGGIGGRIHEGQEYHSNRSPMGREGEKLQWRAFLGKRLRGFNRGLRIGEG